MSENTRTGLLCLAGILGIVFLLFIMAFCFTRMGTSNSPGFWLILFLISLFTGVIPVYTIYMGCLSE